jgi:CubicO group peptidase (beta-lactamase class C family)
MIDTDEIVERLRVEVPRTLADQDVPGAAIGICDASGVLWSQGFGTTRRGGDHPVSTRTMFSVQSVSKMYAATAVMLAVQDGLLDLDEPITSYLPSFTVNSSWEEAPEARITLRHLLSHTAGLAHEAPIGSNYLAGRSWRAHCRSISETWLRFPVGHHHQYSNLGIDLAAAALEQVSHRSLDAFLRKRLFEPLEMSRTTFDQRVIAAEPDRALGHDAEIRRMPVHIPMIAAGGMYASVDDLCRFIRLHLNRGEEVLSPEQLATMYEAPLRAPDQDLGYGLGIAQLRWDGRLIRGHFGGGFGFGSSVLWAPHERVGVTVLTNEAASGLVWDLPQQVFRELLGKGRTPARPKTPKQRFDGTFVGGVGGSMGVIDGNHLPADEGQRYRLDGDYLINNEGIAYYRNDPVEIGDAAPDGPWNRTYKITVAGSTVGGQIRLLRSDAGAVIEFVDNALRLALRQHSELIYFSSTGEALDLSRSPITYGNIPLRST